MNASARSQHQANAVELIAAALPGFGGAVPGRGCRGRRCSSTAGFRRPGSRPNSMRHSPSCRDLCHGSVGARGLWRASSG